jgi:hypothetical protein
MFSLKALRFLERPPTQAFATPAAAYRLPQHDINLPEEHWSQIERRTQESRRASDRREQQHATLLNTRKTQGRRRISGRRMEDAATIHLPFLIKG